MPAAIPGRLPFTSLSPGLAQAGVSQSWGNTGPFDSDLRWDGISNFLVFSLKIPKKKKKKSVLLVDKRCLGSVFTTSQYSLLVGAPIPPRN